MSGIPEPLKKRIWAGDSSVVAEVKNLWITEKISLSEWVSTLYSFRGIHSNRKALVQLLPEIREEVQCLDAAMITCSEHQNVADRADVFATVLVWLGEYELAEKACQTGLTHSIHLTRKKPSHALLLLTCTEINIRKGNFGHSLRSLGESARIADLITDLNQRNRVYRKIGKLYRKLGRGNLLESIRWGLGAVCMQGITPAVRAKSLAALLT